MNVSSDSPWGNYKMDLFSLILYRYHHWSHNRAILFSDILMFSRQGGVSNEPKL